MAVVVAGAALLACAGLAGCPAFELAPCFPGSSASPLGENEGGFSRTTLAWELDKMAALVDAPESDDPPSEVLMRAQRDMRTEFWIDAARGFLAVVRGDTRDGKKIRLQAQYDFAIALFRLRYFAEARRVFEMISADTKHPRNMEAAEWLRRRTCPG
jgi:hypothetical protein